jgi:DNA-directed RNA polymerase subunit beta'
MHAQIKVRITNHLDGDKLVPKTIETSVGRVIFNQLVPHEVGFINELLTKKSLRDIIGMVLKKTGMAKTAKFLDDIKELGFRTAFRGGLSFNLGDIQTPPEKAVIIKEAHDQVEEVMNNYNMGFITNNERYNQIIDIWTHTNSKVTKKVLDTLSSDKQGFNAVYMMLDSGARGSNEQIKQLSGIAIQSRTQGRIQPHGFTHGTSEQRMRWFNRGLESGRLEDGDTFEIPYENL